MRINCKWKFYQRYTRWKQSNKQKAFEKYQQLQTFTLLCSSLSSACIQIGLFSSAEKNKNIKHRNIEKQICCDKHLLRQTAGERTHLKMSLWFWKNMVYIIQLKGSLKILTFTLETRPAWIVEKLGVCLFVFLLF